jgi:hypothetical protein
MRIAFLVGWGGGASTGPFLKIAAQARTWSGHGHDVGLFVATSATAAPDWQHVDEVQTLVTPSPGPGGKLRQRHRVVAALLDWRPEVVYERHGLYHPILTKMSRAVPTVIEVNGDDVTEWRGKSRAGHLYNQATRLRRLRSVAGLVYVTTSLRDSPHFAAVSDVPSLVLGNSVDLAHVAPLPAPRNDRPHLLFMGHPRSPWHGIDQLLVMADAFPEWQFDVVGPGPGDLGAAPPNVTAYGELQGHSLAEVIARADIGVSSLALHRAGLEVGSPLKLREYLALGLPTIIAGSDVDFPQPVPFLLALDNVDGAVAASLPRIAAFVETWRGRRVPREEIRHIDTAVKEPQRLAFMKKVAHGHSS